MNTQNALAFLRAYVHTEGNEALDTEALATEAAALIVEVRAVAAERKCLPISPAADLRAAAQQAWNATAQSPWGTSEAAARCKASVRHLTALCFLTSSNCFAPARVRNEYLGANFPEAEKCVLMCLKTAKALAALADPAGAGELLDAATAVSATPATTASGAARMVDLRLEALLSGLAVHWQLGLWSAATAAAKALRRNVLHNKAYSESLLQLIHAIASEAPAGPTTMPDDEEEAAATAAQVLEREAGLQELLGVSLDLLGDGSGSPHQKRRSLYGATLLLLGISQLRAGAFAAALTSGQRSYDELQSLEPLVLQVRALIGLGHRAEALEIFKTIMLSAADVIRAPTGNTARPGASGPLPLREIFAVALVLTGYEEGPDGSGGGQPDSVTEQVVAMLVGAVGGPTGGAAGPVSTSRGPMCAMVAFLMRVNTDFSMSALCALAEQPQSSDIDDGWLRLCFSACYAAGSKSGSRLSLETRLCLLRTVLGMWPRAGSGQEFEGFLVNMAEVAFLMYARDPSDPSPLRHSFAAIGHHPCQSVYGKHAACQLAFMLDGHTDQAYELARGLLSSATDPERSSPLPVVAAFGTLVNFLMGESRVVEAGRLAAMVTSVAESGRDAGDAGPTGKLDMPAGTRLQFLRVCAAGLLAEVVAAADPPSDALLTLTRRTCDAALSLLDGMFDTNADGLASTAGGDTSAGAALIDWCRILWHFANTVLVEPDVDAALRITAGAINLFQQFCCDYQDANAVALLVDRILFCMETEFEVFVCGRPVLPADTLASYLAVMGECRAGLHESITNRAASAAVLALAGAELCLRRYADAADAKLVADVDQFAALDLATLTLAGVPSGNLEALAESTAATAAAHTALFGELQPRAVDLQLAAVAALRGDVDPSDSAQPSNPDAVALAVVDQKTAAMLFRAFQLAGDEDGLQARVCAEAARCLSQNEGEGGAALAASTLVRLPEDVETVVEFFAVEAWNKTVGMNAARDKAQATSWRSLACSLCALLPADSKTRIAVADYAEQMPLL